MKFGEKLKQLRQEAGYSQEKLAAKINVSRQAITKWETNQGIPDIQNLMAVADLFQISLDELLSRTASFDGLDTAAYKSEISYDIDSFKHFDINIGSCKSLNLSGYKGEKIVVRLLSDSLSTIQKDLKMHIDDNRRKLDLDLQRFNGISSEEVQKQVDVDILVPVPYLSKIELQVRTYKIVLSNLEAENIELDAKTHQIEIYQVKTHLEINTNLDLEVLLKDFSGQLDFNQISANSRLYLLDELDFNPVAKGIATKIYFEKNKEKVDSFGNPESETGIELNGINSELIIVHC